MVNNSYEVRRMGWHTILKVRMHYGPVNGMKADFERFWKECLIMKINHYLSVLSSGGECVVCPNP